jgi:hypothetical protein
MGLLYILTILKKEIAGSTFSGSKSKVFEGTIQQDWQFAQKT